MMVIEWQVMDVMRIVPLRATIFVREAIRWDQMYVKRSVVTHEMMVLRSVMMVIYLTMMDAQVSVSLKQVMNVIMEDLVHEIHVLRYVEMDCG